MAEFAQQQQRMQSNQLYHPARTRGTNRHADPVGHSLLAQRHAFGNQAMQHLLRSRVIQTKLTINEPGDQYEQEADRVAEQVMRMPDPGMTDRAAVGGRAPGVRMQRMCPACEEELHRQTEAPNIQRMCPACEEEEKSLHAKEVPGQIPAVTPAVQAQVNGLRGGGQPLTQSVRAFFEPRFGYDFSQVRIHTDSQASESARAVNARAFTMGSEVVFGTGQYTPGTIVGQRLLAHELTHVVQQSDSTPSLQLQPLTEEEKLENLKSPRFAGNTTLEDAFDNSPALRKGDKGEAVKILQQALIDFLCPIHIALTSGNCAKEVMPISTKEGTSPPDGDFGDETFITVQKFQIMFGLLDENGKPDGRPGRKTLGKLDELFPGPGTPPTKTPPTPKSTPPVEPTDDQNVCGPDIRDPLAAVLGDVRTTFAGWSTDQKGEACSAITGFTTAGMAWDIHELFLGETEWLRNPPFHPPCGMPGAPAQNIEDSSTCSNSVEVSNKCFLAGTVNYAIFGQICRLCNDEFGSLDEGFMVGLIGLWKVLNLIRLDADNPDPAIAWAKAGFHGFPGFIPNDANRDHCTGRCTVPFTGPPFTWVWEPHQPR